MVSNQTSPAALRSAVEKVGSQSAFARLIGVTQHAVWRWLNEGKHLPAEHVLAVETATGISRHDLRPDLYPREGVVDESGHDAADELDRRAPESDAA